jgi:hypothetical protein
MWKPKESFCTVKKASVDPLKENEPCWKLRKGLRWIDPGEFPLKKPKEAFVMKPGRA